MSNALAQVSSTLATRFGMVANKDVLDILRQTAFKSKDQQTTDAQLTALMIVANQYGLNPWTKEIYAFPDKQNGIIPVVGVDGWSRIINEHPQYDGMEFKESESFVTMDGAKSCPEWVECIIYRKDRTHPTIVREYLDECYRPPFTNQYNKVIPGPWQTHTKRFLRHKATIQCARLAFGFVGIYDQDEAERFESPPEKNMGDANVNFVDVAAMISEALLTKTDEEALNYWKNNNAKLAKQPRDHAKLKEEISAHRIALKQKDEARTIDEPKKEAKIIVDDFVASMDAASGYVPE